MVAALLLIGCGTVHAPRASVATPKASLAQHGDAATPAHAEHTSTTAETPLPAGSRVTIAPDGSVLVDVTAPAALKAAVSHDAATGPAAFAPAAPPSPADQARGFNLRLWGAAGVVLALLAVGLAARSHAKAALFAGSGAVAVPLIGAFVNSAAAIVVAAVALTGAVVFFAAWHLMQARSTAFANAHDGRVAVGGAGGGGISGIL